MPAAISHRRRTLLRSMAQCRPLRGLPPRVLFKACHFSHVIAESKEVLLMLSLSQKARRRLRMQAAEAHSDCSPLGPLGRGLVLGPANGGLHYDAPAVFLRQRSLAAGGFNRLPLCEVSD